MIEETPASEPPPPDIRPFGRSYPINTNHDRAVNNSSASTVHTRPTRTRHHVNITSLAWLLCAIFAFSTLPSVSAQPQHDPFTSYPICTKSTPILSFLAYLITSALDALAKLTGIDHLSVHRVHGLAKRLEEAGKIEAGMIPVLVALSGVFAGLTLG